MPETRSIAIPKTLYDRAQAAMNAAGFSTVDEYAAFVLEQVLQGTAGSQDEDEKVKKRLKALGYME